MDFLQAIDCLRDDRAILLVELGRFHFLIQFMLFGFEGLDLFRERFEFTLFVVAQFARSGFVVSGGNGLGCWSRFGVV